MNFLLFLVLQCLIASCLSETDMDANSHVSVQRRRLLGKKKSSSSNSGSSDSSSSSGQGSSSSDETVTSSPTASPTDPPTTSPPSPSPTPPEYEYNDDSIGRLTFGRFTFEFFNQFWFYAANELSLAFLGTWRLWMNAIPIMYSIDDLPLSQEYDPLNADAIDCNDNPNNVQYRTLTGICNDLDIPTMGSVDTRFNRAVPVDWADIETVNDTLLEPNPRDVARDLLHEDETDNPRVEATSLNLFVVAWIQFMIHDWVDHGENRYLTDNPIKVPLSSDDPWYDAGNGDYYLNIARTRRDDTYGSKPGDENNPTSFLNGVTAWWDASMLYGIDQETNMDVRDPNDTSKLRLGSSIIDNEKSIHLAFDRDNNNEITGFNRNWWLGLSMMHTLFSLEHNAIVDGLYQTYGDLYTSDERYNIARLVVSALIAKIHTIEWTPAILNSDAPDMNAALRANWYGVQWSDLESGSCEPNQYPTQNYLLVKQLLQLGQSLKGGDRNWISKYYQFSEEFVSIYRMHQLVPDKFNFETFECYINETNDKCENKTIGIESLIHGFNTIKLQDEYKQDDLIYSFGAKNSPFALHLNGYACACVVLYLCVWFGC